MSVSLGQCKKFLAIVWFSGTGILFVFILLQTFGGKYSGAEEKAWGWFLPTVMPTLFLIIGVLVADARRGLGADRREIDPFLYKLASGLSIAYFLVVLLTVLVQPFTRKSIFEILALSHLWLGPLQGLVAMSLGAFFIKRP